jgi:hypothetical protein
MNRAVRTYIVVAVAGSAMLGALLLPAIAASAGRSDGVASASSVEQRAGDDTHYAMASARPDVGVAGRTYVPFTETRPVTSTSADIDALLLAAALAAALGIGVRVYQRRFAYVAGR